MAVLKSLLTIRHWFSGRAGITTLEAQLKNSCQKLVSGLDLASASAHTQTTYQPGLEPLFLT